MPEVVPPAPDDVVPPAEVVPPPEDEDEPLLRVERDAAGLRVDVDRAREDDDAEREDDERDEDDVERDRDAAGFFAVEDEDDDFDAAERDEPDLAAAGLAAVEREDVEREDDFVAVVFAAAGREDDVPREVVALREAVERRRAGGLRAVAVAAVDAAGDSRRTSSADTRLARPSTSVRRPLISSRTRSSRTSRMRFAATAMSPESLLGRQLRRCPRRCARRRCGRPRPPRRPRRRPCRPSSPSCPSCPFSPWRRDPSLNARSP